MNNNYSGRGYASCLILHCQNRAASILVWPCVSVRELGDSGCDRWSSRHSCYNSLFYCSALPVRMWLLVVCHSTNWPAARTVCVTFFHFF